MVTDDKGYYSGVEWDMVSQSYGGPIEFLYGLPGEQVCVVVTPSYPC